MDFNCIENIKNEEVKEEVKKFVEHLEQLFGQTGCIAVKDYIAFAYKNSVTYFTKFSKSRLGARCHVRTEKFRGGNYSNHYMITGNILVKDAYKYVDKILKFVEEDL